MNLLFLRLSILLSSIRNILSKGISDVEFGTKKFFLTQTNIFICGCVVLMLFTNIQKRYDCYIFGVYINSFNNSSVKTEMQYLFM